MNRNFKNFMIRHMAEGSSYVDEAIAERKDDAAYKKDVDRLNDFARNASMVTGGSGMWGAGSFTPDMASQAFKQDMYPVLLKNRQADRAGMRAGELQAQKGAIDEAAQKSARAHEIEMAGGGYEVWRKANALTNWATEQSEEQKNINSPSGRDKYGNLLDRSGNPWTKKGSTVPSYGYGQSASAASLPTTPPPATPAEPNTPPPATPKKKTAYGSYASGGPVRVGEPVIVGEEG
ncbi:hypothetical protein MBAV_000754, partial [Candidatus Magnetobacterium bavaricum]